MAVDVPPRDAEAGAEAEILPVLAAVRARSLGKIARVLLYRADRDMARACSRSRRGYGETRHEMEEWDALSFAQEGSVACVARGYQTGKAIQLETGACCGDYRKDTVILLETGVSCAGYMVPERSMTGADQAQLEDEVTLRAMEAATARAASIQSSDA